MNHIFCVYPFTRINEFDKSQSRLSVSQLEHSSKLLLDLFILDSYKKMKCQSEIKIESDRDRQAEGEL